MAHRTTRPQTRLAPDAVPAPPVTIPPTPDLGWLHQRDHGELRWLMGEIAVGRAQEVLELLRDPACDLQVLVDARTTVQWLLADVQMHIATLRGRLHEPDLSQEEKTETRKRLSGNGRALVGAQRLSATLRDLIQERRYEGARRMRVARENARRWLAQRYPQEYMQLYQQALVRAGFGEAQAQEMAQDWWRATQRHVREE